MVRCECTAKETRVCVESSRGHFILNNTCRSWFRTSNKKRMFRPLHEKPGPSPKLATCITHVEVHAVECVPVDLPHHVGFTRLVVATSMFNENLWFLSKTLLEFTLKMHIFCEVDSKKLSYVRKHPTKKLQPRWYTILDFWEMAISKKCRFHAISMCFENSFPIHTTVLFMPAKPLTFLVELQSQFLNISYHDPHSSQTSWKIVSRPKCRLELTTVALRQPFPFSKAPGPSWTRNKHSAQ